MNEENEIITSEDKFEVAAAEFDRFAAAWELDTEIDSMSEKDKESFEIAKRKIILQIKRGRAVVSELGDIIYTLKKPVGRLEKIALSPGEGVSYWDMDKGLGEKYIAKMNHYISAACGVANSELLKMSSIDIKFIYGVYGLFLNS